MEPAKLEIKDPKVIFNEQDILREVKSGSFFKDRYAPPENPFRKFFDLPVGEAWSQFSKNFKFGTLVNDWNAWYQHTYFLKKGQNVKPLIHTFVGVTIISYLAARPKLKEHGEHGAYIRKYH